MGSSRRCWRDADGRDGSVLNYDGRRALDLLRRGTGLPEAAFRCGQEKAVQHVVEGLGRLLVVQRTGWGKSFVYFIAAKLLREAGMGPALLVSPLLALMRNQIAAAERMGVRAETINSDNKEVWERVEAAVLRDEVDILLISPERLGNQRFVERVLATVSDRISLLVIDEAHCISDWGHDFRPDYRRIGRMIQRLPANLRLLATTATANDRVVADLKAVLGDGGRRAPGLTVSRGSLDRPSLRLQTIRLRSQAERLAWLAEEISRMVGSGIIYTLTIRDSERVAGWLQSRGLSVHAYSGRTPTEEREKLEEDLLANRVKALAATTALGMGFDKPDLGFVIHFQTPGSVIHYYQQVGRAGRGLDSAWGVLLSGEEETQITDFFIDTAFPSREQVRQIVRALEEAPDGLKLAQLEAVVNARRKRLEQALKILSLESPAPVVKEDRHWQLTAANLDEDFWERVERLTELRRLEQKQMQDYVDLDSGHMEFLIQALDGDPAEVNANDRPPLPVTPERPTVLEAIEFLRGDFLEIEPRKQMPDDSGTMKKLSPGRQTETGRSLSHWRDAGWGIEVWRGKYQSRPPRFSDELVDASARLIRRWDFAGREEDGEPFALPEWVACIPSLRRPELVPDFAARLSEAVGLPFRPVLIRTEDRPPQKEMENSPQQARNVLGSLALDRELPREFRAPVLLVDDIVDSRWTLTVAANVLREAGSGAVWPFALTSAGGG